MLIDQLTQAAYSLGRWTQSVENFRAHHHTCEGGENQVYVFPPRQGCPACKVYVERRVKANHWEIPYRLFGWDYIVYMIYLENMRAIEHAAAYRQKGAYI